MFALVVSAITKNPAQIYGLEKNTKKLYVRAYYRDMYIIPPNHDTKRPVKTIPSSTQIDIAHPEIISFVVKTQYLRSDIEEQLAQILAKPDWNFFGPNETTFRVFCELKYHTPDVRSLAASWVSDVSKVVETFFDRFESKTLDVLKKGWEELIQNVSTILEETALKQEVIAIELDESLHRIKLVGIRSEVNSLFDRLQEALFSIQTKQEIASKTIVEDINNLQLYQIQLIVMLKVSDVLEQSLNVRINVDEKNKTVQIEGVPENIREAKLKILESLQTTPRSFDVLPEFALLLQHDEESVNDLRSSMLDKEFSNVPLEVVWELRENCIILHAKDEATAKKGLSVLHEVLQESSLKLDDPCRKFAIKDNWKNLITNDKRQIALSDTFPATLKYVKGVFNSLIVSGLGSIVLVQLDNNVETIRFYGVKTQAERAKELVNEYLLEKAIYENFIRFSEAVCRYIGLRYNKEIDDLQAKYEYENARIQVITDPINPGIAVRGRKSVLDTLTSKLREYDNKAFKKYFETIRERYAYYHTDEGKKFLEMVKKKYRVSIMSDKKSLQEYKSSIVKNCEKICEVLLKDNSKLGLQKALEIAVLSENIVSLSVDAIVNSANEKLEMLGGVAGAILKFG